MKAAHITITPELMKYGFDFNAYNEVMGSTGWTRNWWAIIDGHTAIAAENSRDLVEYTYIMAGKEVEAFDGGPRPGLHRRMRETIAENLGVDVVDVKLYQREVHL
ncbi:hypothetical protein HO100_11450 [Corynebacterium ulcerans]|uniref:Uncharacterized protein n=1 Tax=Corynebacterium ulcerans FRC58 TaxID=1408268 RepID=A0ABN4GVB2_CORUL|nr:hypothetical protein [Corynebacterium ulcerans]AKN77508.1 Hypothetical protein CulFRC58_1654 [Corynebacterium ulcerans FRC58]NOL63375.1 hypothetical protein [Corynebacterium ulcerans]NON15701.1 hypothetical protein [Corynebacterium ulcerans]STC82378.1 Uncharacterised protein [Corynebacterium ulcerans]STD70899.1 Uncharacterised protein [Corynebacterium ulcerans]